MRVKTTLREGKRRQDKTRPDKTRQDKTRQDKTRQDKTRQDKTRQDKEKTTPGNHMKRYDSNKTRNCYYGNWG